MASTSSWRRHARASLVVAPGRGRWPVALKVAATMFVVLGGAQALGLLPLGMLASLGAFTVLYGAAAPARFRLRLLTTVGVCLVACAATGAWAAGHGAVVGVVALTATAAAATFACLALSVGPPGAFFFVLVHGVAGLAASHGPRRAPSSSPPASAPSWRSSSA